KPPEWWEKQKGSRGIRRGQWYRLVFQFPIREHSAHYRVNHFWLYTASAPPSSGKTLSVVNNALLRQSRRIFAFYGN
ncbi:hypothetical protein R7C51_07970, partial [Salmonella enterica subsp. enterica serovar Typhimurium]|uniref:hypothetical protein n=1 Tax=Salmonella enterica TaxID=28901 RepID=UPI002FD5C348